MKKILSFAVIILMLSACSKDEAVTIESLSVQSSVEDQSTSITNTNWKVTYFWDKDHEETHKFSGYQLAFNANNELKVTSSTGSVFVGTWNIRTDSEHGRRMDIIIVGDDTINELQDDWVLTQFDSLHIKLKDDNTTHLEELFLEKI